MTKCKSRATQDQVADNDVEPYSKSDNKHEVQQGAAQVKLGVTLGGIAAPMAIECRRNCRDSSAAVRINSAFWRSMNWKTKNRSSAEKRNLKIDEVIKYAHASQPGAFGRYDF